MVASVQSQETIVTPAGLPIDRPIPTPPVWSGDERVQAVAAMLWELLPFGKLDLALDYDRTELARTYAESYQRLEQLPNEVARMFEALRDAVLVMRQDERTSPAVRADWLRRQQELLDRNIRVPLIPRDTALTYQTAGQAGLAERLLTSLQVRVQQFATDLFGSLDSMVRNRMLGRIEWANGTDCRITFQQFGFTQEFIREDNERMRIRDRQTGRAKAVTQRSEVSRNTSSVLEHTHELINARRHELSQTIFPVPPSIQAFIETVPSWLRPMLRIVEGTQIREYIQESDEKVEQWRSKPQPIERVVFHNDPALVFFKYVLLGWGQREVVAETERLLGEQATAERQLLSQRQSENSRLALLVGGTALWSCVGLSLLAFASHSSLCLYASWVLGLLAVAVNYLGGAMSGAPDAGSHDVASGFVRAGRALLVVLGIQTFLYGVSGAGIGLVGLSAICWFGLAALRAARKASATAK